MLTAWRVMYHLLALEGAGLIIIAAIVIQRPLTLDTWERLGLLAVMFVMVAWLAWRIRRALGSELFAEFL